jgi:hypothetical protein
LLKTLSTHSLFENELFTIFIKKTLTHLNCPWVQRSTRLYSLYGNITSHGNSYNVNDLSSLARKALQFHFWSSTAVPTFVYM